MHSLVDAATRSAVGGQPGFLLRQAGRFAVELVEAQVRLLVRQGDALAQVGALVLALGGGQVGAVEIGQLDFVAGVT
ncbi:hypothetical protein P4233_30985 [Pseudomonas aeruginosa]|nr:hypothetical protein [Pseudomonas aeruginosa]